MSGPDRTAWAVATEPAEVHELLCASDRYQAERTGTPAPARRIASTEWLVRSGATHVLRQDGRAVAMFTLTTEPPFNATEVPFPFAAAPRYLQRLAVHPDLAAGGSLAGARCVRRALELAAAAGADALRCEANPDLAATHELLVSLGFQQAGEVLEAEGVRRVYLQHRIRSGAVTVPPRH
jgi:hypothetical protein